MYGPRSDDLDDWLANLGGMPVIGTASSNVVPPRPTDPEDQDQLDKLREREARRRPPGFQPWPETTTEGGSK